MQETLKKLAKTLAKVISDAGYTHEGRRVSHRHALDFVAKTGGMKNWQAVASLKKANKSDLEQTAPKSNLGNNNTNVRWWLRGDEVERVEKLIKAGYI